jgi:large subunit ribosomal protein L40e
MKIFVKSLDDVIMSFDVEPSDLIQQLKLQIESKTGIHPYCQRLVFSGKRLNADYPFYDYKIINESTIHIMLPLGESNVN